jgi:hypothetical protein
MKAFILMVRNAGHASCWQGAKGKILPSVGALFNPSEKWQVLSSLYLNANDFHTNSTVHRDTIDHVCLLSTRVGDVGKRVLAELHGVHLSHLKF